MRKMPRFKTVADILRIAKEKDQIRKAERP